VPILEGITLPGIKLIRLQHLHPTTSTGMSMASTSFNGNVASRPTMVARAIWPTGKAISAQALGPYLV